MVVPIQVKTDKPLTGSFMSVDDLYKLKSSISSHYHLTNSTGSYIDENMKVIDDIIDKVKRPSQPRVSHCGSCQAEQTGTKYCHSCQKDPAYQPQGRETPGLSLDYLADRFVIDEKGKFGTFEADYAEFKAFTEYLKFKQMSLNK